MHPEAQQSETAPSEERNQEGISAAALKYNGEEYIGAHHRDAAKLLKKAHPDAKPALYEIRYGFVTTKGRFVERAEAHDIAAARGQIRRMEIELDSDNIMFYLPMEQEE